MLRRAWDLCVPALQATRELLIKLDIYEPTAWPPPFHDKNKGSKSDGVVVVLRGANDQRSKEKLRNQQMIKGRWVFQFVDLVYVGLLSKLSQMVERCALSLHTFILVTSLFAVLFVTRMTADDYGVHFLTQDTFHSFAYGAYFLSNFVMTLNIFVRDNAGTELQHSDEGCAASFVSFGFFIGFFFSRVIILVLFLRVIFEDELWIEKKEALFRPVTKSLSHDVDEEELIRSFEKSAEYLRETCPPLEFPDRSADQTDTEKLVEKLREKHREYDFVDQYALQAVRVAMGKLAAEQSLAGQAATDAQSRISQRFSQTIRRTSETGGGTPRAGEIYGRGTFWRQLLGEFYKPASSSLDKEDVLQLLVALESARSFFAKHKSQDWTEYQFLISDELELLISDFRTVFRLDEKPSVEEAWSAFNDLQREAIKKGDSNGMKFRDALFVAVEKLLLWLFIEPGALHAISSSSISSTKSDRSRSRHAKSEEVIDANLDDTRAEMRLLIERKPEVGEFLRQWLSATREQTLRRLRVVLARHRCGLLLADPDNLTPIGQVGKIYRESLLVHFYTLLKEVLTRKIRDDSGKLIEEKHGLDLGDLYSGQEALDAKGDDELLVEVHKQAKVNMGWVQFGGSIGALSISILISFLALVTETATSQSRIVWPASYKVYAYVCCVSVEIAYSCFKIVAIELQRSASSATINTTSASPSAQKSTGGGLVEWIRQLGLHDYYDISTEHYEERLREFIMFCLGEAMLVLLLPYYNPQDNTGETAKKVYAVQIAACSLLFVMAYQYYHVKSSEDDEDTGAAEEGGGEEGASLEPVSRFLSRWMHLLLSLCIFFTASSLGLMYGKLLDDHSGDLLYMEREQHREQLHQEMSGGGGEEAGGGGGGSTALKYDHVAIVDARAVLATSVGTFVLIITLLRSIYTHMEPSKRIFRTMRICDNVGCKKPRPEVGDHWLRDNDKLKDRLCTECKDTNFTPMLVMQPGKSKKLFAKMGKVGFALIHFCLGFANIKQPNVNIIAHFVLLAVSALTGGSSPWIFKAIKALRGKEVAPPDKPKLFLKRLANNCSHCGIRRGITECPECRAKGPPRPKGRKRKNVLAMKPLSATDLASLTAEFSANDVEGGGGGGGGGGGRASLTRSPMHRATQPREGGGGGGGGGLGDFYSPKDDFAGEQSVELSSALRRL